MSNDDSAPDWATETRVSVAEKFADEEGTARFRLLYEVGKRVLSASVGELNDLALSLAFDCLKAERGALLLRDRDSGGFEASLQRHRDRGAIGPDELVVPTSIISEVVDGRLGILTSDALHDPRFFERASVQRESIRSALCAPLWNGRAVLGVMYLDCRVRTYAFTRDDLVFLNALANLVAIRLEQEAVHAALTRERIVRSNLERYHSPDVVDAILAGAGANGVPEAGLEERIVTVLFIDLQGFTRLTETEPPAEIAEFLDEYYNVVTHAVFELGGTVNDYLGDGILAVFGAPVVQSDHAARAIDAARAMLAGLRASERLAAYDFGKAVRVGINTGRVMVGSVGPSDCLKYAVIGDPVNVASRLQGIGRPGTITLSEETRRCLRSGVTCEPLGPQKLRGREAPVEAFRIVI